MEEKGTNYKIIIQYDGTRYKGWQSQKGSDMTIQGKLGAVLEKMAGYPVEVKGSGRTDAGVHAMGQVANFFLREKTPVKDIKNYLNQYLPEDIGIASVKEVSKRFHARLNVKQKTYIYRIWNSSQPNVFERRWMHTIEQPLHIDAMEVAAEYLIGTQDFAAFCAKKQKKKSTVRTIHEIKLETVGQEVRISVTGNGFLHHMVRILVGTLVEVGSSQRSPEEMGWILEGKKRENAGTVMPAKGLILWQVMYN